MEEGPSGHMVRFADSSKLFKLIIMAWFRKDGRLKRFKCNSNGRDCFTDWLSSRVFPDFFGIGTLRKEAAGVGKGLDGTDNVGFALILRNKHKFSGEVQPSDDSLCFEKEPYFFEKCNPDDCTVIPILIQNALCFII